MPLRPQKHRPVATLSGSEPTVPVREGVPRVTDGAIWPCRVSASTSAPTYRWLSTALALLGVREIAFRALPRNSAADEGVGVRL